MALGARELARPLVGWEEKPWSRFGQWIWEKLKEKMESCLSLDFFTIFILRYFSCYFKLIINLSQICYMLFYNLVYVVTKCLHDVNIVVITWLSGIHPLRISNGILVFMKVFVNEVNTLLGVTTKPLFIIVGEHHKTFKWTINNTIVHLIIKNGTVWVQWLKNRF